MATEDTTPAAVPEAPVRLRRSLTTRQGRKVPRMLYRQQGPEPADDDPIVGLVDTPGLAALIVAAVNRDIPAAAPDEGREPLILPPGEFAALRTVAEKLGMLRHGSTAARLAAQDLEDGPEGGGHVPGRPRRVGDHAGPDQDAC